MFRPLIVLNIRKLTLILLTWRIEWAHNNASKWQIGFNWLFKGLNYIEVLSNISLKGHFPEDGHNRWQKHVAGCAVDTAIHLRLLYMHLFVVLLVMNHQVMVMNHTKSLGYVVIQYELYDFVYYRCGSNAILKPCEIWWLQVQITHQQMHFY